MNNNAKYTDEDIYKIVGPLLQAFTGVEKQVGLNNRTLQDYVDVIRMQTEAIQMQSQEIKKSNLLRVMQDPNFTEENRMSARQEYMAIVTSEKTKEQENKSTVQELGPVL